MTCAVVLKNMREIGMSAGEQMHATLNALTPRQIEVLSLVATGKLNREIAQALGMSAGTVKVHMTAILKALKVRNRTEAAIATRDVLPLMAARAAPSPKNLPDHSG
jgi:DNA-binding NarL/FixJ family response regulator